LLQASLFLFLTASATFAQSTDHKIESGVFLSGIDLTSSVGEKTAGIGGRLVFIFTNNLAFDIEACYFPENPSGNYGQTIVLAGARAGRRQENFGVFAKVRPGVINYGGSFFKAYNGSARSFIAIDVGGVLEYYPSARVLLRLDAGDTIIPFGDAAIKGPLPPYTIRPGTTHNRQTSIGIGFRF
jgi:hypothetical protein